MFSSAPHFYGPQQIITLYSLRLFRLYSLRRPLESFAPDSLLSLLSLAFLVLTQALCSGLHLSLSRRYSSLGRLFSLLPSLSLFFLLSLLVFSVSSPHAVVPVLSLAGSLTRSLACLLFFLSPAVLLVPGSSHLSLSYALSLSLSTGTQTSATEAASVRILRLEALSFFHLV